METNTTIVGLRRVTLKQLDPDFVNALIVGIIISKQRPRRFTNSKNNESRAVWNFTIRDSPQDYINVTFWGDGDFIMELCNNFHMGDIVEISKPRIIIRDMEGCGEQFRPMVTSPYHLMLYGNQSHIMMHDTTRQGSFRQLLSLPTKPLAGFVTLSDVQNSGSARIGYFVDILVAVKAIGTLRSVKTKQGIEQSVRDFIVLDPTCPAGVKIAIWDPELITRAGFWTPRSTILFMTDMKIEYSHFHKTFLPIITSRTIITENPVGCEATSLRNYALTAPIQPSEILERLCSTIENSNAIQNVMSVRQVLDKMETLSNPASEINGTDRHFTVLLYALVTHLDLDGLSKIVTVRCSNCKAFIPNSGRYCENLECNLGEDTREFESKFDLRINLSDHTATLVNCRLTGIIAENVLGCTVDEFSRMTDTEKCSLKWKYLMERCTVRIMVLCVPGSNPLCSILSCNHACPSEVANKLRHY